MDPATLILDIRGFAFGSQDSARRTDENPVCFCSLLCCLPSALQDPETGTMQPVPQAPLPLRPTASGLAASRSGSLPLGGLPSPSTSAGVRAGAAGGLLSAASCPPGMMLDAQV